MNIMEDMDISEDSCTWMRGIIHAFFLIYLATFYN